MFVSFIVSNSDKKYPPKVSASSDAALYKLWLTADRRCGVTAQQSLKMLNKYNNRVSMK